MAIEGRQAAAILFMTSSMQTLDAYSTLNSSPWTAESFGGDPAKAKACKEYVAHAIVFSMSYATAGAIIGETWWPVIGATLTNSYLAWLYIRALNRANKSGSTTWASPGNRRD